MATSSLSYYPNTIDGRAHWWQNIHDNGGNVLSTLGYTLPQIGVILSDAAWGLYCYSTIHGFFKDVGDALTKYETAILNSPNGTAMPVLPVVPMLPAVPASVITAGVEARRILWVQEVKVNTAYTAAIGAQLGIETPASPFNRNTYVCQLLDLASNSPHTVSGKFRKAGGNVDGINLYGRKAGATAWTLLGRYNATPFTAQVPVAGSAPESWEFYAMAVKADVEFGQGSAIFPVIVRA